MDQGGKFYSGIEEKHRVGVTGQCEHPPRRRESLGPMDGDLWIWLLPSLILPSDNFFYYLVAYSGVVFLNGSISLQN